MKKALTLFLLFCLLPEMFVTGLEAYVNGSSDVLRVPDTSKNIIKLSDEETLMGTNGVGQSEILGAADDTSAYPMCKEEFYVKTDPSPNFVPAEIIVKLKSDSDVESLNKLNNRFKVNEIEEIFENVYRLKMAEEVDLVSIVREYEANPSVEYAEPNYVYHTCVVPNDANYTLQWAHRVIESERAWDIGTGDPSVVIAIVDTGVDWDHPDLAANIWNNTDEVIDGLDNDGNGYIDDVRGYDFVNTTQSVWPGEDGIQPDNDPMDFQGHGTHCAGIAAAVTNNGIGIAGVCWNCKIMSVRAGYKGEDGGGYLETDDAVAAIIYAADNGAKMISMSWGDYEYNALLHEAVKYAYDRGVLMVAAAGNEATSRKLYPAAFDEVVAVTATSIDDKPAWFTNFGEWVEVAAPGVEIYSTVWNDSYRYADGTSMSTPHVAGVAALVWSRFPQMTRDWVRLQLRYTVDDLGDPGFDDYYGYGRVNARKAVEQAPPPHDLLITNWQRPIYINPEKIGLVNTTVLNFGTSDENYVSVRLLVNGSVVGSTITRFLASGASATVNCQWRPTIEGIYNVTSYIVPVAGETFTENNFVSAYVYVGFPVKAFVLDSAGTDIAEAGIETWEELNTEWYMFGEKAIFIDYSTLNKENITYEDLAAAGADVLLISCAFSRMYGWEFTDNEIDAIRRYVYEGHGLIATAATLYQDVPNNNKLAPLFGLNESIKWDVTGTDLLHVLDPAHPLFTKIPDPYTFPKVVTAFPSDGRWDSNELSGGTYTALGHFRESAITVFRGLVYISPCLEIIPARYHFHLQLLYNAIIWSEYQKPKHELVVSLESPPYLEPGESTMLNATLRNMGSSLEINLQLSLQIDSRVVNSTTIPNLPTGASYTISFLWTPTAEATYNVTAYSPPVPYEEYALNNVETKMVYVRSIKGRVTFEEAHLPAYTIGSNLASDVVGGYREFANYLTSNGYVVSTIDPGTKIDSGLLATVEVLVIVAPQKSYAFSEIDAIENWVKGGGNLLLIGDWGSFGVEAGSIAERFGISLARDMIHDADENAGETFWPYYHGTNLHLHPIIHGVSRVEMYAGDGIKSAPADETRLIVTDSDGTATWDEGSLALGVSIMNAFEGGTAGSGRIVIITDSNVWDSAYDLDEDGTINFFDSDNEILALNTINWFVTKFEHELAVSLEAPDFLEPYGISLLNATVYNRGLSNESNVELRLMINGTVVNSTTFPKLLSGTFDTINHLWTPTEQAMYNVKAYAPPLLEENLTLNNIVTKMVRVRHFSPIALISDNFQLSAITPILDTMGVAYDIYNDNGINFYTANLDLLLTYKVVIFNNHDRKITSFEHSALQAYLSSGGNLLVTGMDSLGNPDDPLLADIVCSSTTGDNTNEPDLYVVDATHPIMNGPYGSFPTGYHISGLCGDCDTAEANTTRNAVTVAELADGYDKIIATEGLPGKVIYWNGRGDDDWSTNADCQAMFKNTLVWLGLRPPEHELAVSLQAPDFPLVGESSLLKATVHNCGSNNETNVKIFILINGTSITDATVPKLPVGSSYTLTYVWVPRVEGTYNVTAYAPPIADEVATANNIATRTVRVKSFPAGPAICTDPRQLQVNKGELFTVNIAVIAIPEPGLYSWEFSLYYPNDILNATEVVEGPFLKAGGDTLFLTSPSETGGIWNDYNATHGRILLGCTLLGGVPGVNGSGVIATITFNCTGFGTASLHFEDVTFLDPEGGEILAAIVDGAVFAGIWPRISGDLNRDGVVNILDMAIFAKAYGSYPGHPRWNPIADLDGNGVIDILDGVLIAKNFGKTS